MDWNYWPAIMMAGLASLLVGHPEEGNPRSAIAIADFTCLRSRAERIGLLLRLDSVPAGRSTG